MMKRKFPKIIYFLVCFLLILEQSGFAQIAGQLDISGYFSGLPNLPVQDKFRPLHLRSLAYDNINNNFKLLLDKGDFGKEQRLFSKGAVSEEKLESSTKELLNYFFIGISLPNDSFWVNLRPDSPDNIIDPYLAQTDVGKILLEADLQLKKDTALATSPQTPAGKAYWDRLYQKAGELFGAESITIPTLTRPWIVPGEIIIRESTDNAYIYKATLKVMLESDYLNSTNSAIATNTDYSFKDERLKKLNEYSSQLIRDTIIPRLTKEVNTAKRYAPLRQVYYSLILAQWFKQRFYGKGGLYSYLIDKKNLAKLISRDSWDKQAYFKAYHDSFSKGEYNVTESVYTAQGKVLRSYMSGGLDFSKISIASSPINSSRPFLSLIKPYTGSPMNALGGTIEDPFSGITIMPASSPVVYPGIRDVVENLPGEIQGNLGTGARPIRGIVDWLRKVYASHKGLLFDFYHNQGHNAGAGYIFSLFLNNLKEATPRDINIGVLAALLHDFHSRMPEGDKGLPAYVPETISQIQDLIGIKEYAGPVKKEIPSSYKEKILEDLKKEFRKYLNDLFEQESLEDSYNEIEAMILRTDYASDVAQAKAEYKNAAAQIRQRMDTLLNNLENWENLEEIINKVIGEYNNLKLKAESEADKVASDWLVRQEGIEIGYLGALKKINPQRRKLIHDMSSLLETADQTSFYVLLSKEAVEREVIPGLKKEGVVASPEGSYKFFFVPQFLDKPEVLAVLKTLPVEYRKNFVNTMEYFSRLGKASEDWNAIKEDVYYKLGLQFSSSPVEAVFSGEDITGDLSYLESVAKESLSGAEEGFKEKVFLLFGTKLAERYYIKRIIPVLKYAKQTHDYVENDPAYITELIDKYATGEIKLLGALHTHPYDLTKIITRPGPSWQDRLGEDILLPARSEKIIDIPLGIVIEAAVPKDISFGELQDVIPDLNAYFYLPEDKAELKTINVFKTVDVKSWAGQGGNNLAGTSSSAEAQGRLVRMTTQEGRLNHSLSAMQQIAGRLGRKAVIYDIGVGANAVTTRELADQVKDALVYGIDSQIPSYSVISPKGVTMLFDWNDRLIHYEANQHIETGDTIDKATKNESEGLAKSLRAQARKKGAPKFTDREGNTIVMDPMKLQETGNLKIKRGDLFAMDAAVRDGALPNADLVRIVNVLIPHYTPGDITAALSSLLPFVNESGYVLIGYTSAVLSGKEESLVYRKRGDRFVLEGVMLSAEVDDGVVEFGVDFGGWAQSESMGSGVKNGFFVLLKENAQFDALLRFVRTGHQPYWDRHKHDADSPDDLTVNKRGNEEFDQARREWAGKVSRIVSEALRTRGIAAQAEGSMILLGLKPDGDLIPHPGLLEQFKRRYLERGVPEAVGGSLTFSGSASLAEAQVLRAASSPVVYFDPDQNKAMDLLMEDPGAWVVFSDMLKLRLRNDYYGSSIADIFIADAIKIVKNTSGKYKGIGFRLGERSDEVAMVLPGSLDQQEVKNALQDIQQEIEKEYLGYCIARLPDGMDDKIKGLDGVRVAQRTVRELRQGGYEYITTVFLVKDAGDISGRLTLNRILEQSGQEPGLGEVEEALPPYLPAGAARLQGKGAIENKFESSLKEAEIFQRVAKQAGQMVGVEGLIERPRIKDGARMPDYGFSKLKEYISEFNKSLQSIREFAKNRHGDNAAKQVQLDNGYAAFLRRNLFVVLEYAMEKMKSSDSFIFVVRGPPDNFYIITSGKGKWQVTAVRQNILTAEGATFEENFISIIEGSGRRLRAAGKFPFKVINDFDELGHYFGNQLIRLDNINLLGSFNQQILKAREGNGILDTQAISQALSNASKNISNLLNEHEFDFSVNFEAISVTSDDFVSGAIQSPTDIAREALDIIDKLSSARKTVEVPGNSVKFYSEFKERWQEVENEIGFIAATKAKNAKIGLKETHKNINLPEEVSASSPVVTELIKRKIEESKAGRITFKEFMGLALYSENGYYSGGVVDIGAETEKTADFGTFPEIAPVTFGCGTAEQIVQMWENMGKPLRFQVVEMGAGNGTWALRILEYLKEKHSDLFNALEYTIVEISPGLAKRQKEKLEPKGYPVKWVIGSAVDIKLPDVEGVFISNELPDAFAVHKIRNDNKGAMKEVYVVFKDGKFKEELGQISDEQINNYVAMLRKARGDVYVDTALSQKGLAVNLDMMKWQEAVYNSLKRGYVITIDTGFNGESLGSLDGQEPPLRVYSSNHNRKDQIDNPDKYIYGDPGKVDIISDVDFKLLAQAGANLKTQPGFKEEGLINQYKFFLNIYEQRKEFAKLANDLWDPEVLHDDVFYVLIQSKGNLASAELIGLNPVSSSPITELRRAVHKLHNKKFNINGGIYVIRIENGDSVWDTSIVLRDKDNLEVGYFRLDTKSDAINNGGMLQIIEEKRRKGFALFILSKLREVFPENKELVTEIGHGESLKALRNNQSIDNLPIVQLFNAAGWELIELVYYDALGQYLKGDFSEQMSLDASKDEEGPVIARFKPKITQPYLPGFNHPASSPLGQDAQVKVNAARLFNENKFGLIRKSGISLSLSQPFSRRHVVIGDIHGDFEGLKQDLRDAGLVDIDGDWIGGDAVLIQMGDVIDRGEQSFEAYEYLSGLRFKARAQGGEVRMLLGNHENMFFRGMSGDSKQLSDWVNNLGSGEFKKILRDTIKNKGSGIARRMILTGESGEFAKWRKLYLGFSEDIKKGEIQAAYEESGVLFVHGGINAKNKHSLNAKGEADFLNRQLAVKNLDGIRDALWNSFGYEVNGEGINYLQIVAHTPELRVGAQVAVSPNGKVVNVDVGHWIGYGENRGYVEINGRNLQAYALVKESVVSSPVTSPNIVNAFKWYFDRLNKGLGRKLDYEIKQDQLPSMGIHLDPKNPAYEETNRLWQEGVKSGFEREIAAFINDMPMKAKVIDTDSNLKVRWFRESLNEVLQNSWDSVISYTDTHYHIFTAWELIVLLEGERALEEGYLAAHYPVLLQRIKENFNDKQFDFDYAAYLRSEYDKQVQIIVKKYKSQEAGEDFRSEEGKNFSDRAAMEEYRDRMLELLNDPPEHYKGAINLYCDLGNKDAIESDPGKVMRKMIIEDNGLGKYAAGTAWKFIRPIFGVNIYFGRKGEGLGFIKQAIMAGKGEEIKISYGNGKDKLTRVSFEIPFESFEVDPKKMNALLESENASSPAVDLLEQSFSADSRKIVEFAIDPFSPATIDGSLKNRLIEATDSGQVIKLNLSNLSFDTPRFNQAMAVFNLLETILSEGLFTKLKIPSYDLRSAIRELLMNAFFHGNKLDFSLPIYLYFDFVNQKIEVYDLAVAQSQTWEQDKPEAEKAGIGGKGSGLKLLTQLGWGYALEPVRALNSDRQAGNKIVAYRSTPGGIDFRALPITSQPALINQKVNANTIPPIPLAELNSEWIQIENMLAAGITPSSERIKEYLQSCSQKQDFNQDIDKVLSCIADMLRLEEERVVSTDLSLKEMLALLESGKPVNDMQLVLAQITVEAEEPKLIE
jgi:SAM-dependent MidA family methyltransferase